MELDLTDHARCRCQQRGASRRIIAIIATLADRTTHVGSGVVYKYLTRKRIDELCEDGRIVPADCERLTSTSLLMDPVTGTIISILKGGSAARGLRRYRRGQWFHQPPANDNGPRNGGFRPAA